jgi:hypothetical protein
MVRKNPSTSTSKPSQQIRTHHHSKINKSTPIPTDFSNETANFLTNSFRNLQPVVQTSKHQKRRRRKFMVILSKIEEGVNSENLEEISCGKIDD